jgi:hypothetical protein
MIFLALALSMKASVFNIIPGVIFILVVTEGIRKTLLYLMLPLSINVLIAYPFLKDNALGYIKIVFNLGD